MDDVTQVEVTDLPFEEIERIVKSWGRFDAESDNSSGAGTRSRIRQTLAHEAAEAKQAAENAALRERVAMLEGASKTLSDAVAALPVEDMVDQGAYGEPELLGYCMQAQGEWDNVSRAKEALDTALKDTTT